MNQYDKAHTFEVGDTVEVIEVHDMLPLGGQYKVTELYRNGLIRLDYNKAHGLWWHKRFKLIGKAHDR